MVLVTDNLLNDLFLFTTTFLVVIYAYFQYSYKYWEKRGVPFLPPKFPVGNSGTVAANSKSFGLETAKLYEEIKKRGWKFGGIYTIVRPVFVVADPDYVKDVLAKDFQFFVNRGHYHNERDDPISAHLFALDETKWKNMRTKLTPTFTSGKIKMMFNTAVEVSNYMIEAIEKTVEAKQDIDVKEVLAGFSTDVIGSCAYGIDCNSSKNPDAEFRRMGRRFFEASDIFFMIKGLIIKQMPEFALTLGLKGTPEDVAKFFHEIVEKTIKYREENNVSRPDFLQLLIDLKNTSKDSPNPFTMEQIVSQVFLFFIAGFDTSSTTMNFAIYELCKNPDIQDKVRNEINEVLEHHGGKITYESLGEMDYLQQVIDESQRLYPPVTNLTRRCVKNYNLRDSDIIIEKGTHVVIPVYGLHRDPDYFPDPDKFDPDRFSSENKKKLHPFVHLPFGEGPRNCIGLRFGLMQSKIGLIAILRNFRLKISPSTKMPLQLDPQVLLLRSVNTFYATAEKI